MTPDSASFRTPAPLDHALLLDLGLFWPIDPSLGQAITILPAVPGILKTIG